MKEIKINLENCYGINKLEYEFDFSKNNTYAIYASNGTMKTSFTKTFVDLMYNTNSKDLIYSDKVTQRIIQDENSTDIDGDKVFVIESEFDDFQFEKISNLMVSKDIKIKYDALYLDINKQKDEFIKKLKDISKSTDCEYELLNTFKEDEILNTLKSIYLLIEKKQYVKYNFKYNDVFDKNNKVKDFISENGSLIDTYIKNYENILSKSDFFQKSNNSFGTYQAKQLENSIEDNSFFEAGHILKLKNNVEIKSKNDYMVLFQSELGKILNEENLKKDFDRIDKKITGNAELRAFKKVLELDNGLLIKLKDYDNFKKDVWCGFTYEMKSDLKNLLDNVDLKKKEINEIIKEANKEKTQWEEVVEIFNDRFFNLPFKLKVSNKTDVILGIDAPVVEFIFLESNVESKVEKNILLQALSKGEMRALYILNILFEIKVRENNNEKTLIIIDDVADSFDYKNKYSIIEYLKDISKSDKFIQIILTHNFDFFRTIQSRFIPYNQCLMVEKNSTEIKFINAEYIKNPFINWIANFNDEKKLIATIPFVRNLIEYTKGESDTDYIKLTGLLHIKTNTYDFTIKDLKSIYQKIFTNIDIQKSIIIKDELKLIDIIYKSSNEIVNNNNSFSLENKIILAITIRLKTEEYIYSKISDKKEFENNQLRGLFDLYKKEFSSKLEIIKLLEQIVIMTPEIIHLNSFMYEPILDMSDDYLRRLYVEIQKIMDK